MGIDAEPADNSVKVAFDTSALLDWHRKRPDKAIEVDALADIFRRKRAQTDSRWYFIYLDAVRREVGGQLLNRLAREAEIQDILPCFDQTVSLSRVPMIIPVTIIGRRHAEAVKAFRSMGVSQADSSVLADAVFLECRFLVTTDKKVLRNQHALGNALTLYELTVLHPTDFAGLMTTGERQN